MTALFKLSKSILKFILKILSLLLIVSLLLSYLAPYLNPEKFWIIAFLGLLYPVILIANIIIGIIWLILKKWIAIFHLFAIFIGWYHIGAHFQYSGKKLSSDSTDYLKIISYNVKNFDLYHYTKDWDFNTQYRDSIFSFLSKQNADIICFQEFVNVNDAKFSTNDTLIKLLRASNIHTEYTVMTKYKNNFGIATFSAYPIVNGGRISFPGRTNNTCIYSDIVYNNDTIRVYNVHFESIHFSHEDYRFAEKLADDNINFKNRKEIEHHSKKILSRLKKAFIIRASQADIVSKNIMQSPYPVIVCGDFNDTPGSYAYHKVSKGLKDAFIESGVGLGTTYSGIFPSFRIDYILHGFEFESRGFTTFNNKYSDHYPIMCYLKLKKK